MVSKHFHNLPDNNHPLFFNKLSKNIYNIIRNNYRIIQKITENFEFEYVESVLDKINQTVVENKESKKQLNPLIEA